MIISMRLLLSQCMGAREPSFGMGVLEVKSATEAEWTWHRNQDGMAVVRDRVTFTRGDPACAGRRAPPPPTT